MKDGKPERMLDAKIEAAVEAPVDAEQREIEAGYLAGLIQALAGENAALKWDLLSLAEDDFHFRDYRGIFAAVKALVNRGQAISASAVSEELADYPETCQAVFTASPVDAAAARSLKDRIQSYSTIRQALQVGNEFIRIVKDASAGDVPACFAKLREVLFNEEKTKRLSPAMLSEAEEFSGFLTRLEDAKPGHKTGFCYLDELLHGLKPGLFVLAAPPSAGKTTFLKQIADQVAENNKIPVLFFSYEQSADELRMKTLARISEIENDKLRRFASAVKTEPYIAGKVTDAAEKYHKYSSLITIIEAGREHTTEAIRLIAQEQKHKTGHPPLIVIDYLQIVPSKDRAADKRLEIDYLISDLRRMARDLDSPIITASAVSRRSYGQREAPQIDAFKESGGIEFGADIAAVFKVNREDGARRSMELYILKNRNGRRGIIPFTYDMPRDTFTEEGSSRDLSYTDVNNEAF